MIFKSIKWRLQIWHGLILVIVLAAFGYTALELERGRQFRRIDDDLRRRVNVVADALRLGGPNRRGEAGPRVIGPLDEPAIRPGPGNGTRPPREFRLPPEAARLFGGTNGFFYVVWGRDGRELERSDNAPELAGDHFRGPLNQNNALRHDDVLPAPPPPQYRGPIRDEVQQVGRRNRREPDLRMHGDCREMEIMTPPGERILVGRSVAAELRDLNRAALKLAGVGGVILILGLAGGWWIAGRAIRPIARISEAAVKISDGDLAQRIDAGETEGELGRLAGVLNHTFARLEAAFEQQRQFTSDAAHELRTPVSVILTQTQSTLNRERSAAEYRETLEACQRAAQRMRRLIESLLQLARLDAAQDAARHEPLDLSELARDGLELVRPLAADRHVTLKSSLAPAPCCGDDDRLALVITNLMTNAIHYNHDGGEVEIRTGTEGDFALVTVMDNGPGIAPEHLPHIFDRFYRADTARTAAQGRTGLGLAITKAIVEAHAGQVTVASEAGSGSKFEVRLPRSGS